MKTTYLDFTNTDSLRQSLETLASEQGLLYLLAHSIEGVIWGRFESNKLVLAPNSTSLFVPENLFDLRAFGEKAEILAWNNGDSWQDRLSQSEKDADTADETVLIWGTRCAQTTNGFSLLVEDGKAEHWFPKEHPITEHLTKLPAYIVRHAFASQESTRRVIESRFVNLEWKLLTEKIEHGID